VYPITQQGRSCVVCGEPFEETVCSVCGRTVKADELAKGRSMCKACWNYRDKAYQSKSYAKMYAELDSQYKEWLDRINAIPRSYPTLTEKQWLEACRYFKGCAICGSEDIESRGFFISFDLGGRYCNWNVIPLCDKCSGHFATNKNPYRTARFMDRRTVGSNYANRDRLDNILKYLGEKINDTRRFNENS